MYGLNCRSLNGVRPMQVITYAAAWAALTLALVPWWVLPAAAQDAAGDPKATEQWSPVPPVVSPARQRLRSPDPGFLEEQNLRQWSSSEHLQTGAAAGQRHAQAR